jgi:hypothetical protein
MRIKYLTCDDETVVEESIAKAEMLRDNDNINLYAEDGTLLKTVNNLINDIPNLFSCYEQENYLVIETPFLYPDGDPIELFINTRKRFIEVTDMGETLRFLMSYGFDITGSQKRRKVFHDILASMGAKYFKGAISIRAESNNNLSEAIFSLSQVIIHTLARYGA